MARPPRYCWVHTPKHIYRNLPRPNYGATNYDSEEMGATPEHFEHKLDGPPPKLLLAWLYRPPSGKALRADLQRLFGFEPILKMNKIKVFKNTPYYNNILWRAKAYLQVRPLRFPNGEPTEEDLLYLKILPNGDCIIDKTLKIDEKQLTQTPEDDLKNFPRGYITSTLLTRWHSGREIQEDDVWADPNHSRI